MRKQPHQQTFFVSAATTPVSLNFFETRSPSPIFSLLKQTRAIVAAEVLLEIPKTTLTHTKLPTMAESPVKLKPTSRVIDSLQTEIDGLKAELENVRLSQSEYKKKHEVLASKHESLVDQLANAKHENDMVNALLKRKERRIADLEDDGDRLSSANDSLRSANTKLKIRCDNLQDLSAERTAEYERMKIAYDALIASQNEYKRHYQAEVARLAQQFEAYKRDSLEGMSELSARLESNDKDMDTLLDGLVQKRKVMDNLYVSRNRSVLELLAMLSRAAKAQGEESRTLVKENISTINLIREKFPDLQDKIAAQAEHQVDLDELLSESLFEVTFAECDGDDKSAGGAGGVARQPARRRKNKRASMRVASDDHSEALPRARPHSPVERAEPRRPMSLADLLARNLLSRHAREGRDGDRDARDRDDRPLSSPAQKGYRRTSLYGTRNNRSADSRTDTRTPSGGSANSKRRLFYGGSNNYNNGTNRRTLGKVTDA